jgi:O-antigen/teichoic acid export membrane protein
MSAPTISAAEGTAHAQSHRKRALSLAVATSLLSKGGTLVIQALAMPLAYHVLGPERFGVFGALQMLMWLIGMSDFGVGAGISRRLTVATSLGDAAEQSRVMSTGFFMLSAVILLMGLVGAVVLWTVPVETLFGEKFGPFAAELQFNAWFGGGIFLCMMIIGTLLKVREAYHEIHVLNLFGAVGNVITAVLLLLGIRVVPQVWFLLASIYGIQVMMWLLNAAAAFRKRPWLIPKLGKFDRTLAGSLVTEGVAFFLLLGLTPMLGREFIRWLIGHYETPEQVGLFSILAQIGYFIFGFVFMVTYPLTPALVDAAARQDFSWIQRTRHRLMKLWVLGAIAVPLGLYFLGPWMVDVWFQRDLPLTGAPLAWYGVFFIFTLWTHIHCILLAGVGKIREAARRVVLEGGMICLAAWLGVKAGGMNGALIGASIAMLVTSFGLLPWLLQQSLPKETTAS